jgi:hypothetical protein
MKTLLLAVRCNHKSDHPTVIDTSLVRTRRLVQLSWAIVDTDSWKVVHQHSCLVKPKDFYINMMSFKHYLDENGLRIKSALAILLDSLKSAEIGAIVGHDLKNSLSAICSEANHSGMNGVSMIVLNKPQLCLRTDERVVRLIGLKNSDLPLQSNSEHGFRFPFIEDIHRERYTNGSFLMPFDALQELQTVQRFYEDQIKIGTLNHPYKNEK